VASRPPSEDRGAQRSRDQDRSQDATDKAVGSVASVLGLLVVVVSVPTPSRTRLVAKIGVLLGVFGYHLGARWLGNTAIVASTTAILIWLLA
jgi:apolipoprotein N-acyltransferase